MKLYNALSFFLLLLAVAATVIPLEKKSQPPSCHPGHRDALLRLKNSFSITAFPFIDGNIVCVNTLHSKMASWREDRDYCLWEGVQCDPLTGDVVGLDLSCAGLRGDINSHSSLFCLRHLRSLSLFGNDFIGSSIPPEISFFSRMTYLNLSSLNISGNVPTEIFQLSKLISLDLSGNGLKVENPTMRMLVKNLTRLEELNLSYVNMSAVIPTSLMNFSSSLISLNLSYCGLGGKFPENIFQLPNLQRLDLSFNSGLHGPLPGSNWSSSLVFLSLTGCSFNGVFPHSFGRLSQLTSLDLSGNNFTAYVDFQSFSTLENLRFLNLSGLSISGEDSTDAKHKFPKLEELIMFDSSLKNFPCFLSSMPELRSLQLSLSDSIIGEFPGQCANDGLLFPRLQILEAFSCKLTKFPSFLSHSKKLNILNLSGNKIEQIPSWFWGIGIDTLEVLDLSDNLIRGRLRLPWKRLFYLDVQNNLFEGPLPIPTSRSIQEFWGISNRFNGSIPPSMCQKTALSFLTLGQNNLTGVIPQCVGNLTHLLALDLSSNSLTGPLPPSLANCTGMESLNVSFNYLSRLSGDIFLQINFLYFINLSTNKFEGLLPLPSYSTYHYLVSNNHFSGEFPSSLCNATELWILDLSNNGLTGTLPLCLKNITMSPQYLNLRENEFHGSIPEIFPERSSLTSLDFSRNRFEGSLPRSLSNCKRLEALDVGSNKIVDSFTSWLDDLPLKVLILRSNKFHGRLSVSEGTNPFPKIRVLDLSNNNFEGNLSDRFINEMLCMTRDDNGTDTDLYMEGSTFPEYYSVMINLKGSPTEMMKIYAQFAMLDFSSNRFQGEIPRSMGYLTSLKGLNLSHNGFTGTIPPSLGNLTNLESLDLSSNYLVGGIPRELAQLTSLGALGLSRNNLTGPIPLGGHFDTFPNSSFDGNPGLCGIPLTRACSQGRAESQPPQNRGDNGEDEAGGWSEWKFPVMGFGSGLGIGISLGYIAMETGRPLWLARMDIRLETSRRNGSKRKSPGGNGRR